MIIEEEKLLKIMIELSPEFKDYYYSEDYLLAQDDRTIEPPLKDILIEGFTTKVIPSLFNIGIIFHNNQDEIFGNLYNINRVMLSLVQFVKPEIMNGIFNVIPDLYDNIINQISDNHISASEVIIEYISMINNFYNNTGIIQETLPILQDSVCNNEDFINYLRTCYIYKIDNKNNDFELDSKDIITVNQVVIEYIKYIKKKTIERFLKLSSIFKLDERNKNTIINLLNQRCEFLFVNIFSNRYYFLRKQLINGFQKVNPTLLEDFVKNNDYLFYKYKFNLNSLSPISVLIILLMSEAINNEFNIINDTINGLSNYIYSLNVENQNLNKLIIYYYEQLKENYLNKE